MKVWSCHSSCVSVTPEMMTGSAVQNAWATLEPSTFAWVGGSFAQKSNLTTFHPVCLGARRRCGTRARGDVPSSTPCEQSSAQESTWHTLAPTPQNVVYQNTTTSVLATSQFHKKQYRQLIPSSTDIKLPQESNLRFWPIAECWGPGRDEEQLVAPRYCQPA